MPKLVHPETVVGRQACIGSLALESTRDQGRFVLSYQRALQSGRRVGTLRGLVWTKPMSALGFLESPGRFVTALLAGFAGDYVLGTVHPEIGIRR